MPLNLLVPPGQVSEDTLVVTGINIRIEAEKESCNESSEKDAGKL